MLLFYDLVTYLMRMGASNIAEKYTMLLEEDLTDLKDSEFKFHLFSSYNTPQVPFGDVMKYVGGWANSGKIKNFKYYERIEAINKEKWDTEYFKDKIPEDLNKVYICGSEVFIESITKALVENGVNQEIIMTL